MRSSESLQYRSFAESVSLYVHVPFCTRLCPYCTFYREPHRAALEQKYIEAVTVEIGSELADLDDRRKLRTVYIGGGSPSVLKPESLDRLFGSFAGALGGHDGGAEQTFELNPEDVTGDGLEFLAGRGINRISLGIQSLEAGTQRWLGRCGPEVNIRAINLAREFFENINLDLLVGVPGRSIETLDVSLNTLLSFEPDHVSVYCLEVAEDGPDPVQSFLAEVEPDHSAREYLAACEALKRRGYRHYEVSNFARPGYESSHNRVYWMGGEYIGAGPGAHSLRRGRRYHNEPSLPAYLKELSRNSSPLRIHDRQDAPQLELERMMLALRTDEGLAVNGLNCQPAIIEGLVEQQLGNIEGGRLRLTDRGFLLLDEIVLRLTARIDGTLD
jgi:oxygen-independent coproporphyrinogen-3 oxidase